MQPGTCQIIAPRTATEKAIIYDSAVFCLKSLHYKQNDKATYYLQSLQSAYHVLIRQVSSVKGTSFRYRKKLEYISLLFRRVTSFIRQNDIVLVLFGTPPVI